MSDGWLSPIDFQDGDALTAGKLRQILASLEGKFNGGITGNDLDISTGTFRVNADIDLLGHMLVGASNVPTGIVSVKSHGVLGDGVTEEGAKIQVALETIASSGGRVAFFPGGTYVTNQKIAVPRDLSIFGSGTGSVISFPTANDKNAPAFELSGTCTLRDMAFVGDTDPTGKRTAILIGSGTDITIDNVSIQYGDVGIAIAGMKDTLDGITLTDIRCSGTGRGLSAASADNLTVMGFSAAGGVYGIYLNNCEHFKLIGVTVNTSSADGIKLEGCKEGTVIAATRLSQFAGINVDSCERISLVGCHALDWSNNAGSAYSGFRVSGARNVLQACHAYMTAAGSASSGPALFISGEDHIIDGCVLGPARDSTGALVYDRETCYRRESSTTIDYGTFKVVL